MSETTGRHHPGNAPPGGGPEPEDDVMDQLLELAGRRPAAPEDVLAEVRHAARLTWQAKVETHATARRRRRWGQMLAAAAVLTVAASLALFQRPQETAPPAAPIVATVDTLLGTVLSRPAGPSSAARPLAAGDTVPAGATLETAGDGRTALVLAGGTSLRLDVGTRLELASATDLVLERGGVYLDSGPAAPAVAVATPFGVAHDIGTQFEVRLLAAGVRVRVREGEVRLERDGTAHQALSGTELTLRADGSVERTASAGHGSAWDWVLVTAPVFELEGRTLSEYLAWVSRETGWRLQFAERELERQVETIVAHGSIAGLSPDQSLEVVLPSSELSFRVEDGTLHVVR